MADNVQTNVQLGDVQVLAGEALTSKEGFLAMISNASGTAKAYLPNAATDEAMYVIIEGAASGSYVTLRPLAHAQQVRIRLNGTVDVGARVKLVTPDGTNDGKVDTIGSTAGTYFSPGIALEAGTDEQNLLVRPEPALVKIASSLIGDPAATAADPDALTASDPAACADMTTDLTGVDTGTDMTAAQAAQIVADLAALKTAIDGNNAAIDAVIDDITSIRTQLVAGIDDIQANNAAIDSIIDALQAAKLVATS